MSIKKEFNDDYPELNNSWVEKLPRFKDNEEFSKEKQRISQRLELYKKDGDTEAVFKAKRWLSQVSAVNAGKDPIEVARGKYDNFLGPIGSLPQVKPTFKAPPLVPSTNKYPWDNKALQTGYPWDKKNTVQQATATPAPKTIGYPTLDEAKSIYNAIKKNGTYYDRLNDSGKKAFWQYMYDNGLISADKLNDRGKAEYQKYVDPSRPEYRPQASIVANPKQYYQTQNEKIMKAITPIGIANMVSKSPEQIAAIKPITSNPIGGTAIKNPIPKTESGLLNFITATSGKAVNTIFGTDYNQIESMGKGMDTATDITGAILGYAAPVGEAGSLLNAAGKLTNKLGNVASKIMPKAVINGTEKIAANKAGNIALNIGKKALEGAPTGAVLDALQGVQRGENKQQIINRVGQGALIGAAGNVGLSAIGKAITGLRAGKLSKIPVPEVAATKASLIPDTNIISQGKYKVKNTALDKAIGEYNNAIETIQNYFQTNQLRTDEMVRIKSELGIDLDSIVRNIENAEKGVNLSDIGARRNLSNAAGVTGLPKINKPALAPQPLLGIKKASVETAEQAAATALKPLGLKPARIEPPKLDKKLKGLNPFIPIGGKEQSLKKTILNSPLLKPEMKQELKAKQLIYNPIANPGTLENARRVINSNYDEAIRRAKDGPTTAENNAIGMELVRKLQGEGRYSEAIDIIESVSRKATESGQAIQALSMWGRLTPEGMLKYTQKLFDKSSDQLAKDGYKLVKRLKLTEDFAKDITGRMAKINTMPEGRAKTVEIAKVLRDIDEQIPKSVWRKVSTIQTMAQLLNPKTMVRNTVGNAIFGGLENISNAIGTPIDAVISKMTGQRTTILPSLKTQLEAGGKGFVEAVEDALQGVDTRGLETKFELGAGNTFKRNTLLGKLETGLNVGLRATDAAFSDSAKAESLRQQMRIAGVTKPAPGMIEIADKVAKYRTFQDSNNLSEGFKRLKDGLNRLSGFFTGTTEWGLGDLVLKYTKTPANILARGIDYSPVSVIKAINEATKPLRGKMFNQKEFVDTVARGTTGTGLIVLGYQFNKLGLITGAADMDYDVASLKRDIGQGEYRLNTTALRRYISSNNAEDAKPKKGDTYVSWDWTAPTSIMLGIGANVSQNKGNTADLLTTLIDASVSGLNTIVEQPLLTGVRKLAGGNDPVKNISNVIQGAPASFTPSLLNQVKQLTDNTTRNYYSPDYGKEAGNMVKARLPILSKSLEPRITTLGKVKETYQNDSNNLLNVFLNPAYVNKYDPTPAAEMVLDIYEKSGERIQFPRIASTYIMREGKKINLLPNQVTALQKRMGEETLRTFNELAKSPAFRKLLPEEQAKKLQSILTKISQEAREKVVLPQLGIK